MTHIYRLFTTIKTTPQSFKLKPYDTLFFIPLELIPFILNFNIIQAFIFFMFFYQKPFTFSFFLHFGVFQQPHFPLFFLAFPHEVPEGILLTIYPHHPGSGTTLCFHSDMAQGGGGGDAYLCILLRVELLPSHGGFFTAQTTQDALHLLYCALDVFFALLHAPLWLMSLVSVLQLQRTFSAATTTAKN